MKRKIFIFLGLLIVIGIFAFVLLIILSFTFLKKTTDSLMKSQRDELLKIVRIPNAVPPSNPTFSSITYTWEMETTQKEVVAVNIVQSTGFARSDDSITVSLEKSAIGDPSVFDKVLPAVIADEEVAIAAYSNEKITSLKDGKTGFKSATITRDANEKVSRITWVFDKNSFGKDSQAYYSKLNSTPEPIIKFLYAIQSATIGALSGQ